jgi:hypothetical protein
VPKQNAIAKIGKDVVTFGADPERDLPGKRGHATGDIPPLFDPLTGHPATGPPLLTVQEVAAVLRCSTSSLNKWRLLGLGPRFVRVGSRVRYHVNDIVAYVRAQTRSSTSQSIGEAS